jgi:hypothetical protein
MGQYDFRSLADYSSMNMYYKEQVHELILKAAEIVGPSPSLPCPLRSPSPSPDPHSDPVTLNLRIQNCFVKFCLGPFAIELQLKIVSL